MTLANIARVDQLHAHIEEIRINMSFAIAAGDQDAYKGLRDDLVATLREIDLLTYA